MKVLSFNERKTVVGNILSQLLRVKGIKKYRTCHVIEEGSEVLPGRIFPISGRILTGEDKLYSFWLGWLEPPGNYELGESWGAWREVSVSEYEDDPSIQIARKELDLPYNTFLANKLRDKLSSLMEQHNENNSSGVEIPNRMNEKLQRVLKMINEWNDIVPGWVKAYLKDKTLLHEKELVRASSTLTKIVNTLSFLRDETKEESNAYINWASSLSALAHNLLILFLLEK